MSEYSVVLVSGKKKLIQMPDPDNTLKRFCQGRNTRRAKLRRCARAGHLEYKGKWFCGLHHPPSVKSRKRPAKMLVDSFRAGELAERARCAAIAEAERVSGETGTEEDKAYNAACEDIAAAIRGQK